MGYKKENYTNSTKIFKKNSSWKNFNASLIIVNKKNDSKEIIVLENWEKQIFLDADGNKSVYEYFKDLKKKFIAFDNKIPNNLDEHFNKKIDKLVNHYKIIDLY